MKFENTRVFNFDGAFRGMRNPMNSWDKSDSSFDDDCCRFPNDPDKKCIGCEYFEGFGYACLPRIGPNDLALAQKLIRAGSEHRKFMRQIFVSVDITAPLYFVNEFVTYKVGTTMNSCSLQHKGASRPFTIDDFTVDDPRVSYLMRLDTSDRVDALKALDANSDAEFIDACLTWTMLLERINRLRELYVQTKNYNYFRQMRQLIPMSYNYKFTWTGSYENLLSMRQQRRNHKLGEWRIDFMLWLDRLPYAKELLLLDTENGEEATP